VNTAANLYDFTLEPRSGLPSFLAAPAPRTHAVQFYDEETFLFDTVGKFLQAGLSRGDQVFVVATKAHADAFLQRLDPSDLEQARDAERITILDAHSTLSRFMVGDMPDAARFRDFLAETMGRLPRDFPPHRVRAYGEMVDMLASEGNVRAAVRLEELWHEALEETPFSLLCAYLMENFFRYGDRERLLEVFANHSHVIPTESFIGLACPDRRLREIALLQQRAVVLENEQEARRRSESSDAFKEQFLGILGHDLRNPLNTILTTVRMMALRKELAPESHARLERVVASSVRMQRMIEQLLDVAQARLPDGLRVCPGEVRDLAPLVATVVGEVSASSPSRAIELVATRCVARVDVVRFEQAVWSLLSYAVAHSDSESAIRVLVRAHEGKAHLSVQGDRVSIDSALLPTLFDSFQLEAQPDVAMDGLALGLYLAKRIVTAHGGNVEARSSKETGTTLEAILALA
jgi:signal transduction histidine kinase